MSKLDRMPVSSLTIPLILSHALFNDPAPVSPTWASASPPPFKNPNSFPILTYFKLLSLSGASYYLNDTPKTNISANFFDNMHDFSEGVELENRNQSYVCLPLFWENDGAGICCVSQVNKHIIIVIRGTKATSLKNIKTDLDYYKTKCKSLESTRIHRGFNRSAQYLLAQLQRKRLLPMDGNKESWEISLTGHSLGGAVACVLAMHLFSRGFRIREVVTYGQPMVTNLAGALRWQGRFRFVRMVNDKDPIPSAPPLLPLPVNMWGGRFHHFGERLALSEEGIIHRNKIQDVLDGKFSKFWKNLFHGQIALADHRSSSNISYKEKMDNEEEFLSVVKGYRGDYFDELLFAMYRFYFEEEVEQSPIVNRTNSNPAWVEYKVEKNYVMFKRLLKQYCPNQMTTYLQYSFEHPIQEV